MCGRYTLHLQKRELANAIALALPDAYAPDYNIGPGRATVGIVMRTPQTATATMLHWGLRTPQNFHINARIETAATLPRFRDSWHQHRCLLPANGFYEWYRNGSTKQPYYIYPKSENLIYFAGLCFTPPDPTNPLTCVILTTQAQAAIRDIHERMPVIIPPSAQDAWLSGKLDKPAAQSLTHTTQLTKHTVSHRVNSVRNKDSHLMTATSPPTDDQMTLF